MRARFGDFVLDKGARQLVRRGQPVHLSPKGFELLLALIEARPHALAKEELLARVWPGTHVMAANLSNLVGELRDALGDDPRAPLFIRTVPRFGYAFQGGAAEEPGGEPRYVGPAGALRLVWEGGRAALREGEQVVGRDEAADVPLPALTLSRRHALIRVQDGEATIEDDGSKNGTFVNEERVGTMTVLRDGDEIRFGTFLVVFRSTAGALSTRTGRLTR